MDTNEQIGSLPCLVFTAHVDATGELQLQLAGGAGLHGLTWQAPGTTGGERLADAVHPDDRSKFMPTADRSEQRVRLRAADGEWRPCFLHRGDTVSDAGCSTYTGLLTDATGQQALSDDAQRYRDYAEMSSDWYWEQDEHFCFTYFSREFEEVTGLPSKQGLGKTRWQGLGKERLNDIDWVAHEQCLREHRPFRNLEYPVRRLDGTIIWVRVSGKPRFNQTGRFTGYFGIAANITASKKMEAHLHQSERLAAIGQLAAGMAHEINNPVSFVRSNLGTLDKYLSDLLKLATAAAGLAADAAPSPEMRAALLREIAALDLDFLHEDGAQLIAECRDGLDRVRKIVADLREFAHEGESGWSPADLNACLDSAINLLSGSLADHVVVNKAYATLPLLRCRPGQINQVALALLSNAVQAMADQGGQLMVASGQEADGTAWFEVRDNGCGIAAENLPRIFEPFFTTRPVGQGTGMGLATCFAIVAEHGGHIDVHSTPGSGSCFRVSLPRHTTA